jgi:hypothetical protein
MKPRVEKPNLLRENRLHAVNNYGVIVKFIYRENTEAFRLDRFYSKIEPREHTQQRHLNRTWLSGLI